MKTILDVACGGRMFYFDKKDPRVLFCDGRKIKTTLCDGRKFEIDPDHIVDFRELPFENESFKTVIFDPPHLIRGGAKSWLVIKYGLLSQNWQEDLSRGFAECFRVLERGGVLIFKWSDIQIPLKDILKLTPQKPVMGSKQNKTYFLVFIKE